MPEVGRCPDELSRAEEIDLVKYRLYPNAACWPFALEQLADILLNVECFRCLMQTISFYVWAGVPSLPL
jgi:hypothetical protein